MTEALNFVSQARHKAKTICQSASDHASTVSGDRKSLLLERERIRNGNPPPQMPSHSLSPLPMPPSQIPRPMCGQTTSTAPARDAQTFAMTVLGKLAPTSTGARLRTVWVRLQM